ncbi:hypothetical protein CVT25_011474 [Psilocybe cyanescens]|uniref:Uncharacterized protein n=1 Tax=Psilocybe cyanescens TaxID=93625 RepID=A0A409XA94_PSICY|nr:hypothetical protein CVT25_011474 [Psilocybe cyanescens]
MPMKEESAGGLLQFPSAELDAKLPPLPMPLRETDASDLQEFWKQYMRTPLSGPGPAASGLGLGDLQGSQCFIDDDDDGTEQAIQLRLQLPPVGAYLQRRKRKARVPQSGDSLRSSSKRLPLQTLGLAKSEQAFLGFAGEGNRGGIEGSSAGRLAMSHPDRVVASLSERRRWRMSAPGASLPMHLLLQDSNRNSGLPEQRISGRPYAGDTGGAVYAPAAQARGTN